MTIVLLAVLGGLAFGLVTGGSLERLGELPLRRRLLVVAAVLAQVVGSVVAAGGTRAAYPIGMVASALLVAAFLRSNLRIPGIPLAAAGFAANALVVGLNGAMPVDLDAAARAGVNVAPVVNGVDARHEVRTDSSRLGWLSDVVPVPTPWGFGAQVASPGDLLVAAGLGLLVAVGCRGPRRSTVEVHEAADEVET